MSQQASVKRSAVWTHFTQNGVKVKCNLCSTELSYAGGSTGTMQNHLKFKHPALNSQPEKKMKLQTQITAYKTPVMSKDKWVLCTQKLAGMCARDLRPINIVEGVGFKAYCRELNPAYEVPSRPTVAKHVHLLYDQEKQKIVDKTKGEIGIALTTDIWTSTATEGYLTLTCHFLNESWSYQNIVLATREMNDRHTGENIASEISGILSEFQVAQDKVVGLVTDNASNMVSCAQALNVPHFRCFGHTLQLAITNSFTCVPLIQNTIASAKATVSHFRRSVVASSALETRQTQMNIPKNSLIIDVATRWNSTYDMFERLLQQRLPLFAVIHDTSVISNSDARRLDISEQHWKVMEALVPVLKPLYLATRVMCSEEYPTISGILPIVYSLINNHLNTSETDISAVEKFKTNVANELEKRFKLDTVEDSVLAASSFLDPRYKTLPFLTDRQRECVIEKVRMTASQLPGISVVEKSQNESASASSVPSSDPWPCNRGRMNQNDMAFLLGGYYDDDCEIVTPDSVESEIELYCREKAVSTKCNPFAWWKSHGALYPKLSFLARKTLAIPGTSVPSERVFSTAGGTVTKLRASLDPSMVDKLVFLNKAYRNNAKNDETQAVVPVNISVKREPADTVDSIPIVSEETTDNSSAESLTLPTLPRLPDI